MNMAAPVQKEALWSKTFIYLLALGMLTFIAFFMINPVIARFSQNLGATLAFAGVVAGLFSLTALAARPMGAVIVDRLNKKTILIIASGVMAVSTLGYAISVNVAMVVFFRVIQGIAFAVSTTATSAMIATVVPRSRLGEGVGYYGMSNILAIAIGPNIGIWVADAWGYPQCFAVAGVIMLVSTSIMFLIPFTWQRPVLAEHIRRRITWSDMISLRVLPLAIINGIFSFSNGISTTFLKQVGEQRHIANVALYFTVMAASVVLMRPFIGKVSDRKGLGYIVYPAFIMVALDSILLARANVLWVVLIAGVFKAFGQGAAFPSLQAACLKKHDVASSGVAATTFFIGADIGQGVGPMIGGAITQAWSFAATFYFTAGLLLVGFVAFWLIQRYEKKRGDRSDGSAAIAEAG
jgi:predicted MFS family arabinose efflux permease